MNLERAYAIAYDLQPHRPGKTNRAVRAAMTDIMELDRIERKHWKPRIARLIQDGEPTATGGQWYQDTRPPWLVADTATTTLTTAQQQVWSTADLTPTYASDWWHGKLFMIRCFGRITTPAGSGPLTVQVGYGTTNAAGALATSAALTVVASQANMSWRVEARVRCRSIGPGATAGILIATGVFEANATVQAQGGGMIPATAPAQTTGLNLNQTSGIHVQMTEAATTGATVVVHDLELVAEN